MTKEEKAIILLGIHNVAMGLSKVHSAMLDLAASDKIEFLRSSKVATDYVRKALEGVRDLAEVFSKEKE